MIPRITYPAPHREWHSSDGLSHSTPWTLIGVLQVMEYGGWFSQGCHDFVDRDVAKVALGGAEKLEAQLVAAIEDGNAV